MACLMAANVFNRRAMRRERVFRDRYHPLERLRDHELIALYRFPRHELLDIIQRYTPYTERASFRNHALPSVVVTLIGLKYFASGGDCRNIGEMFGVCPASVSRCVNVMADAISNDKNNWISFPRDNATLSSYVDGFHAFAGFPDCIGAIDGTLIRIKKPSQDEHIYVCRKGYHALNVLLVCNADQKILFYSAKYPGSSHDSFIYRSSGLSTSIENGHIPRGLLVGDSGFRLDSQLMTPFLNPANRAEEVYNRDQRLTRCVIERTNGTVKSRFRCLDVRKTPRRAAKVVMACCVLHNRAVLNRVPLPDDVVQVHVHGDRNVVRDYTEAGQPKRANIVRMLSNNR